MAIYITNNGSTFNNKNNLIIVFKNDNDSLLSSKRIDNDFIFIFNNKNEVVGINIFNYKKYFKEELKEGYHLLNEEMKKYLLSNYKKYLNEKLFDSFIQVGNVLSIISHAKNEKLKVLKIDFGWGTKTIITNLQSIKENCKYLFALSGAITATGLKIVNSKILGEESQGMIMSYSSIGINKEGVVQCNELELGQSFKF